MNDTPKTPPKVFDVMRPGKAPASPTSRPVIVGHKPEFHDEIVGGEPSRRATDPNEKRPLMDSGTKVTIQPTHVDAAPEPKEPVAPTPAPEPAPAAEPKLPASTEPVDPLLLLEDTIAPEPTTTADTSAGDSEPVAPPPMEAAPLVDPQPEAKPEPKPDPAPAAPVLPSEPETPTPALLTPEQLDAAVKEPENKHPLLQKGEGVYVSNHRHKWHWLEVVLTLLIILILSAIVLDVLLDAEIIKTDLSIPHTNWL